MRKDTDYGAVLPFVALMLLAVMTFFGFVLDINMLASSREQAQHFGRIAALAALEQYHDPDLRCSTDTPPLRRTRADDTDPTSDADNVRFCTPCEKYNFAVDRVNALMPDNETVTKDEEDPELFAPTVSYPGSGRTGEIVNAGNTAANCAANGVTAAGAEDTLLVPGEMVADDAANSFTPCEDSDRRSPCFFPMNIPSDTDFNDAATQTTGPSAFGIRGRYYRGISNRWMGKHYDNFQAENNIQVDAIAAVVPRRGCFLVDVSRSAIRDTHIRHFLKRFETDPPRDPPQYLEWLDSGEYPGLKDRACLIGQSEPAGCVTACTDPKPYGCIYDCAKANATDIDVACPDLAWGSEFAYHLTCPLKDSDANNTGNLTGGAAHCRAHEYWGTHANEIPGDDRFTAQTNLTSYDPDLGNNEDWGFDDRGWEWLRNAHDTTGTFSDRGSTFHFADSYVIKHTYGDEDYNSAIHDGIHPDPGVDATYSAGGPADNHGSWFTIDMGMFNRGGTIGGHNAVTTANGAGSDYFGPEPLISIFQGIENAIAQFEARQVAGDMACVIFYDRGLTWPRVFNMTDNFTQLRGALDFDGGLVNDGDSDVILVEDAADTRSNPAQAPAIVSGFEAVVRHGLFPRSADDSYTNATLALAEALNQINDARVASGIESSDFIVNISDGMLNCKEVAGTPPTTECSNDWEFYRDGMAQLKDKIENDIWANPDLRNIPIHMFVVGSSVGPHSLDLEEPDSTAGNRNCYPLHKAAASGFPAVRGDCTNDTTCEAQFDAASEANPFFEVNEDWYEIVKLTRGIWAPIRPQFEAGGSCHTLVADSDGDPCEPLTYGLSGSSRRMVDPFCRTRGEQINAYVDLVLGDNPYRLVEPQWDF